MWWYMPIIPAMQGVEVGKSRSEIDPSKTDSIPEK
jgi:hypothetical protein